MDKKNTGIHCYDDMIHLPHHVSATRPHMPISDRAAQFAPFAALTGHNAAMKETARFTEEKAELDENAKAILDKKLRKVQEILAERPEITVTYFQPDNAKSGGSYVTVTGNVKKIDVYGQFLELTDGLRIPIDEIFGIESETFRYSDNGVE